ncbi:MAG: sigma-70 family RNA polymerase sigma factor [Candidatus Riflebacteria bacterium]|nr:sigma-70 family RNA polymerase sigma factor [Candidatus Riflebacteria bacterium]
MTQSTEIAQNNDSQLIDEILHGQPQRFEVLIKRYQSRIEGYIFHFTKAEHSVQDLTQETFTTAFVDLSHLKNREKFKSWLFGIAHIKCLQWFKNEKGIKELNKSMEKSTPMVTYEEFEPVPEKEIGLDILNRLSQLDSLLVWLKFIEELPYSEIAELIQMSEANIRQRCCRALAGLRKVIL